MVQSNIMTDVCNITRIPTKVMSKITTIETLCIGSAIHDAVMAGEDIAVLNIGIGTLSIELATKQCKFVPSRDLKNNIKKSVDEKVDPIEIVLDQAIIDKLLHICDEVI